MVYSKLCFYRKLDTTVGSMLASTKPRIAGAANLGLPFLMFAEQMK